MLTTAYSYESATWSLELWEIHEVISKLSGTENCQKGWWWKSVKVKVKFILEQATKVQRKGGGVEV